MKRLVLAAALLLVTLASWAQTAGQGIYKKFANEKNVSGVYISPAMFSIVKRLPDMDDEDIKAIKSLSGFYVMEITSNAVAAKVKNEVNSLVSKNGYELYMEAVDEDEKMQIFCYREAGLIKSIILLAVEPDETEFVCIEGEMSEEMLQSIMDDKD